MVNKDVHITNRRRLLEVMNQLGLLDEEGCDSHGWYVEGHRVNWI